MSKDTGTPLEKIRVWVDYISIPQKNRSEQKLAIASLPTYFATDWRRPCREFTPRLVEVYRELRQKYKGDPSKQPTLCIVSWDNNQDQYDSLLRLSRSSR